MRMRYKMVAYNFGADQANPQSVQRHYRELMDELMRRVPQPSVPHHPVLWRPASDIHETTDAILVKMDLAGIREEDLEITLYEDALVVSGRRDDELAHDPAIWYHEAQIHYGPFRAEVFLPSPVRREVVEARYENGILRIILPKETPSRPVDTRGDAPRDERASRASQSLQASGTPVQATHTTEADAGVGGDAVFARLRRGLLMREGLGNV